MHQDLEENMAIAQTDMKKILLELQSMVSEIRENEDEAKRQEWMEVLKSIGYDTFDNDNPRQRQFPKGKR